MRNKTKSYMKIRISIFLLVALTVGCSKPQPTFEAPLLKNIGDYSVKVSTSSEYAQRFFDQGVIMANGFNHAEAERSFREAVRQDSTFALGYWGIAYVLGPNYNSGGESMGMNNAIRDAVGNASRFAGNATPWEQALIKAIEVKFPTDSAVINAEGYSTAMKEAYTAYPDNDFVATLYAESVMNLHPWDFYLKKGGEPRPWTPEIISLLEEVIAIKPENPLANHLYIHAIEASADVDKALTSAEQLKTLVPAAGHLVHMPSHIYINTGDYHEGSIANERAVEADSIYIAECKSQGVYPQLYYPHNYHFLAATAAFEGRGAKSIEAAYKTVSILDKKYFREAGYETVLHYSTIPLHVLVKFEQWEKLLAVPEPEKDLVYPRAIWFYAKGMAYANQGKFMEAKSSLDSLNKLSQSEDVKKVIVWAINPAEQVCRIASNVLTAELAYRKGDKKAAISFLKQAIEIEDQLNYDEPPDWFFSVRHILGDVYMQSGDFALAEAIYREDLSYWRKNGFALNGLYESLKAQNKVEEANQTQKLFEESWKYADIKLKNSRVDPAQRKDLALKIDESSPNQVIYLAGVMCVSK
jgi:tetratricopeptide (TPR) repeat protein